MVNNKTLKMTTVRKEKQQRQPKKNSENKLFIILVLIAGAVYLFTQYWQIILIALVALLGLFISLYFVNQSMKSWINTRILRRKSAAKPEPKKTVNVVSTKVAEKPDEITDLNSLTPAQKIEYLNRKDITIRPKGGN